MNLTVTTSDNFMMGGVMFNVEGGYTDVTINEIMFEFNGGRDEQTYELYYKPGTLVGYNENSDAWTLACAGSTNIQWSGGIYTNTGNADYNGITDKSQCSITIPAGETYAIYIHGISRAIASFEEGSSFSDIVASDNYLSVYTGLGISSSNGPFSTGFNDDLYMTPKVRLLYSVSKNHELVVTTLSNTGIGGIMFDVISKSVDITINEIMFKYNGGRDTQTYELYYKQGSLVGFNNYSAEIYTNTGNADYSGITDKSQCSFTIPAGETYAIYIHGISSSLVVSQGGSSFSDIVASDNFLSVHTGLGISSSGGPFGNGKRNNYYVTPSVKLFYSINSV